VRGRSAHWPVKRVTGLAIGFRRIACGPMGGKRSCDVVPAREPFRKPRVTSCYGRILSEFRAGHARRLFSNTYLPATANLAPPCTRDLCLRRRGSRAFLRENVQNITELFYTALWIALSFQHKAGAATQEKGKGFLVATRGLRAGTQMDATQVENATRREA
jgi:hypothetical protein